MYFDCQRGQSRKRVVHDVVVTVVQCFISSNSGTLQSPHPLPSSTLPCCSTYCYSKIRSTPPPSKWFVQGVDTVFGTVIYQFIQFVSNRFLEMIFLIFSWNNFAVQFVNFRHQIIIQIPPFSRMRTNYHGVEAIH
jgi:hypothetical protein